jgi:tagaturonate reductase
VQQQSSNMMQLSTIILKEIQGQNIQLPDEHLFGLPEKVLQFGTGVLLRGLPDYFIDKANKTGLFNGRVVVVKSTAKGGADAFDAQHNLYTQCVRGIEDGREVKENIINAAISRVLHAATQWQDVLECARNPDLQIIISNTTEVGIALIHENIGAGVPDSFPGKLLAFLVARFHAFGGSAESGMVIIPTELLLDNGKLLKNIVMQLARYNNLPQDFITWLETHNRFCSSLVDRIVPGHPGQEQRTLLEEELGYKDNLLIVSEAYRLWAIEGDEKVAEVASFAAADAGVIIAPDIERYRELKLRLLNGTHTLSCGLALLAGFETVREAMNNAMFEAFVKGLMQNEIAPAIPCALSVAETFDFSNRVLDRFRNPNLQHHWIAISMQYSSKVKMRVVPLLLHHYKTESKVPELIARGVAAYILFTKPVKEENGNYIGIANGNEYVIQDNEASFFMQVWQQASAAAVVQQVLCNTRLWGHDLTLLAGFANAVTAHLDRMLEEGGAAVLRTFVDSEISSGARP